MNIATNAPKITPEHVEGIITSEHYFTGYDGRCGARFNQETELPAVELDDLNQLKLLTF